MDHLAFELTRHSTYSKFGPEDLESMGKQAASEYLGGGISLNDAIVKIAKQHPSISSHQVRRIVEFANQETFSRLFEKQAGDKNVEFDVADPGEVLHSLDNGARPSLMVGDPPDYSIDPIAKTSASDVEADLALTRMFMGTDFATPGSEKTAVVLVKEAADGNLYVDRILGVETPVMDDSVADRILKTASVSEEEARSIGDELNVNFGEVPFDQFHRGIEVEQEHNTSDPKTDVIKGGPRESRVQAAQVGLGHIDEFKDYYTRLDNMEEEAEKDKEEGKTAAMDYEAVPQRPPVQAATAATAGVNDPAAGDHPEDIHQKNVRALDRRIEIEKKKQELAKTQFQTQELLQGGGQAQQQQQQAPAAVQQAMQPQQQAPQQAAPMPQQAQKMAADLTKQAMAYVKCARPNSNKVLEDLQAATSLAKIKEAAAGHAQYPMADPYGELVRTKQRVGRLLDDAVPARDVNAELAKEAQANFEHHVTQFMFDGGNLGEVVHVMELVGGNAPGILKEATTHMIDHLIKKGLHIEKTRAEMMSYEMSKAASDRTLNPENPLVESFNSFFKLASNQPVLEQTYQDVRAAYDEVESTIKEVMRASPRQ